MGRLLRENQVVFHPELAVLAGYAFTPEQMAAYSAIDQYVYVVGSGVESAMPGSREGSVFWGRAGKGAKRGAISKSSAFNCCAIDLQ